MNHIENIIKSVRSKGYYGELVESAMEQQNTLTAVMHWMDCIYQASSEEENKFIQQNFARVVAAVNKAVFP